MRGVPKGVVQEEEFYEESTYTVDPGQAPLRIDKFLFDRIYRASRNRIQSAIRAGAITVNGKEIKPNYKVRPNDDISVILPKPFDQACKVIPDKIDLDIRYEDEDLIVVHKPAGMVVHPGIGNYRGTMVNALMHHLQNQELPVMEGNPSNRAGLVHRIDKNTSGLLVVAKTDYALTHLANQFFKRTTHRKYHAIIWGEPEGESGYINKNIGRDPRHRKKMTVFEEEDKGKWAGTFWKMIEPLYYVSLIECKLETGRTHQIRVHMNHLGHPLFNDERYGGDKIMKGTIYTKYKQFVKNCFGILPRQALHAKELGFIHPSTNKEMYFDSDLPEDMANCLNQWRTYVNAKKSQKGARL